MPADPTPDALLLSVADVCRRLSIGRTTLHAMTRTGRFPLAPIHLGRAVRFKASELEAWVAADCPGESKWRAMTAWGKTG
jgi:excisionase family DNA binding protein